MEEVKVLGKKHIKRLNKGANLAGMLEINNYFREAIKYQDGKWVLDELGLDIALHRYNTANRTSRDIIEGIGYEVSKTATVKDIEKQEEEEKKEAKPKEILKELLTAENEKDIISYLVARKNGYDMRLYQPPQEFKDMLNLNDKFSDGMKKFIRNNLQPDTNYAEVKKAVYKYLGIGKRFENVIIEDLEGCKDELLELGEDSKRLSKVLKIISSYSLEVVDTNNVKPATIKKLIREKFGLKTKKDRETQKYKIF